MTRDAFGHAYQSGYTATVRFLLSRGARQEGAREAAQAAWARAWERLDQLHNESLVHTWVNTIALNAFRDSLRYEGRVRALREQSGGFEFDHAAIDAAQILRLCSAADRRLLEQQMRGATAREIARQHGSSETAVRIRLLRARRAAKAQIDRRPPSFCPAARSSVTTTQTGFDNDAGCLSL